MKTKFTTLFVLLLVAVMASACGTSAPQGTAVSVLSQNEATAILENAMLGFQKGDYAAWSRDWSSAMKDAIREKAFLEFREQVTAQHGQFVSIQLVEIQPGAKEGYVRWVATCDFEKGQIKMNFSFLNDGVEVEGVFPEVVE